MITITREELQEFLRIHPFELKPGQSKISFPIIERIHERLQSGYEFGPVQVNEDTIVDGHHRFICLTILGMTVETIKGGKNASLEKIECSWEDLSVQEDDYDSPSVKKMYDRKFDRKR